MTIHHNLLAPGIAVECDDENFELARMVHNAILRLSAHPLGKEFLSEFDPAAHPNYPNWGPDYKNATVLITQPDAKKPRFGQSEAAKLKAAETKLSHGKQKIICWWPGSAASSLKKGIKFIGTAEFPVADSDKAEGSQGYVEPGEFLYYGERERFEIVVVHELIHAYHGLQCTFAQAVGDVATIQANEEKCVVGIYEHKNKKYTENKFRFLFKWPPRTDYKGMNIKEDVTMAGVWDNWCSAGGFGG